MAGADAGRQGLDFFISHAGPDRAWAEWVAWHLTQAGYTVELDAWDWAAGDNFVLKMNDALASGARMVALLSQAYFDQDRFTTEEWTANVAARKRMIPLRIDDTPPIPILRPLLAPALHEHDEPAAVAVLLEAVQGPLRPTGPPTFPGASRTKAAALPAGPAPRLPSGRVLPAIWNVRRRNPHFTGREGALAAIRTHLVQGSHSAVQAWHGLGGIGKTQIALEYAHRFASQYDTVWWIDAEQADQLPVHYTALAERLGVAHPGALADHNARLLLDHLRTRERWLIVLDNAEAPELVEPWLPEGPGHVLITSRNRAWETHVPTIAVDVFSRPESLAYLIGRLPTLATEDAESLAEALGDLPLALAQAAGVLGGGLTPDRYRQLLAAKTAQILAHGTANGYPASLGATVAIATDRLTHEHEEASALLRLAAFLGPEPIPTNWLETARPHLATLPGDPDDPLWLHAALEPMTRLGLARADHATLQVHRLTQAALRAQTSPEDTRAILDDIAALLAHAQPDDPDLPSLWPTWALLHSHLIAQDLTTDVQALHHVLLGTVLYLLRSGQPRVALDLVTQLHTVWADSTNPDDPDVLGCAQYLAHARYDLGEYNEARRISQDTLERRRRVLGEDHPDTFQSAHDLATTLHSLGEYAEDRRISQDTLERRRRVLGEDHPDTLRSAQGLATTLHALGEYAEARRMCQDALERQRRILGEDHPDTLHSAIDLAASLHSLGEYAEARRISQDTLERQRRILGEDHPDTLYSAQSLAATLHSLGEYAEARRISQDTLERQRRILGEDHPDTLYSAIDLSATLHALGEYAEARRIGQDTLERRRRVLGEDHPDTLRSAHGLATTLHALGDRRAAVVLLQDAFDRSRSTLGTGHPLTKSIVENLAAALMSVGRRFDAQKLLAQSQPAGKNKAARKRRR